MNFKIILANLPISGLIFLIISCASNKVYYVDLIQKPDLTEIKIQIRFKEIIYDSTINYKTKSFDTAQCNTTDSSNHQRSTESILKIIRENTPKLKNIFCEHLKSTYFIEKLRVRFTINPNGNVVMAELLSCNVNNLKFTVEMFKEISLWKFQPVNGCKNDVVTVPFYFSDK